jgi:hypothetical protein
MVEYRQEETEKLGEKPVAEPLCPTQIPHVITRWRTRAYELQSRQLTA